MSNDVLRIILAVVVGAHGVGHALFLVSALGLADWGQSTQSWLLTHVVGDGLTRLIGVIIWLVATAGFGATAVGMFTQTDWWRTLAVMASTVSIVGLVLFWADPVASPVFSALVADAVVLLALLVFHWPPTAQIGA